MFSTSPRVTIPDELVRPELQLIAKNGYQFDKPHEVVDIFEKKVAKFAGAKYAVAVDSCSNGLFLCLTYLKASGIIRLPKHTYLSVPMQILHAGCQIEFTDTDWVGKYQLDPYLIWDAAGQWKPDMYESGFHVTSFQFKKPIPIGRGGMILTNDINAYNWMQRARYDGRDITVFYPDDNPEFIGWHFYMTPEDAARGILLMDALPLSYDDVVGSDVCIDISTKSIFNK